MALHKSERHCPECDFIARKGGLAKHIHVHHKKKVEKKWDSKVKNPHDLNKNSDKITEEDIESPFIPLICEVGDS